MQQNCNSIEIELDYDDTIQIPTTYSEFRFDARWLLVSSSVAACINVNEIQHDMVNLLRHGATVREILQRISFSHGVDFNELFKDFSDLMHRIESAGFYKDSVLAPRLDSEYALTIRITERCNLRCTHCLLDCCPEVDISDEIRTDAWKEVIGGYCDYCAQNDLMRPRIIFSGGEPLLRADLFELAAYARSLGGETELFTNGLIIQNKQIAKLIESHFDSVQVSLDGASPKGNDQIRGTGSFKKTIKALRLLHECDVKCTIATTVTKQNISDLYEHFSDLISEFHDKFEFRISLVSKEGRATSGMTFDSTGDGEIHRRNLIKIRDTIQGLRPIRIRPNNAVKTCGYFQDLIIGPCGDILPCGASGHSIGKVTDASFVSLMNRSRVEAKKAMSDNIDGCRSCDIINLCGGVCRLVGLRMSGNASTYQCTPAFKTRKLKVLFERSLHPAPIHRDLRVVRNSN